MKPSRYATLARLMALAALVVLVAAVSVLLPSDASPVVPRSSAEAAADLVVDTVRVEGFPRLAVRFTITGRGEAAPRDLTVQDIVIGEGDQTARPVDVQIIRRAYDGSTATFEATWVSRLDVEPGETVMGGITVTRAGADPLSAEWSYARPVPQVVQPKPEINQLREVPRPPLPKYDLGLTMALAATLGGTTLLCVFAVFAWKTSIQQIQERLTTWVIGSTPRRSRAPTRGRNAPPRRPAVASTISVLSRVGARMVTPHQSEKLRHNLVLAGRPAPHQYVEFVAIKVGLALVLALLGLWVMWGRGTALSVLAIPACLGMAGFILPNTWLGRQITKRQYEIRKGLPDALDLMTIGVSAGLAFDGAIAEIVDKWDNALSREFAVMLSELRMGTSRREALLGLSERTDVEEINTMVTQLIQAEELGMSLTDALLTLSSQMRVRRRQQAEEQAHKAAIKMLIPLVFLIFPALFVVILGPAVPDMLKFMSGGK